MPEVYCEFINNIVWQTLIIPSFLPKNSVDVWRIRISDHLPFLHRYRHLLNADELTRASRYHQKKDSERFMVSRGMLKILLGNYLHQDPSIIQIQIGHNKKPFVETTDSTRLLYNTAHAGNWILFAFSDEELGVDVEQINNSFEFEEILNPHFSRKEIDFIQLADAPRSAFFLLWTRKEALTKATAKGLDQDLHLIPSLEGKHKANSETIASDLDWLVKSFEIQSDYFGSLAYPSGIPAIRFFEASVVGN